MCLSANVGQRNSGRVIIIIIIIFIIIVGRRRRRRSIVVVHNIRGSALVVDHHVHVRTQGGDCAKPREVLPVPGDDYGYAFGLIVI
jgi:hypothetical protein